MLLVLDASVIGKWFKEEVYSKVALKIRDDFVEGVHEIVVPDLLLYEISNAMRYDKKFDSELTKESIKSLLNMDIAITLPSERLLSEAVDCI